MSAFRFIALYCLLLLTTHALAENKTGTEATSNPNIVLTAFEPGWWRSADAMDNTAKVTFFQQALDRIRDQATTNGSAKLNRDLLQNVVTQGELLISDIKSKTDSDNGADSSSDKKSTNTGSNSAISISAWLDAAEKLQQQQREQKQLKEQIERIDDAVQSLSDGIANTMVKYNALTTEDAQRINNALSVIHSQLLRLRYQSEQKHLKSLRAETDHEIEQLKQYTTENINKLKIDENTIAALREERDQFMQRLNEKTRKLDNSRQQAKVDALTARTLLQQATELWRECEVLKTRYDLLFTEQQIAIGQSILKSGEPVLFDEQQAKIYRQQKADLEKRFSQLFSQSNQAENNDSNDQSLWQILGKANRSLQSIDNAQQRISQISPVYKHYTDPQGPWLKRGSAQVVAGAQKLWSGSVNWLTHPLFSINDSPVTSLDLLRAFLVLTIALIISRLVRRALTRFAQRKTSFSEAGVFTVGRIIHYVIIVTAVMIAFATIGIDLSKLALVAGALSVGIGFGLQSIFNNFISGLILLFERPLKVGDVIELESGVRGRIKSINVRSTQVTTWDNIDILVPNSEFISGRVTNYTFHDDLRRLHIPFGVAYGSDKALVRKAAMDAASRLPFVLQTEERKPDIWLVNYGASSLDFELLVWINGNQLPKNMNPVAACLWELETALGENGLEIPFPQRDLHVRSVDEELLNKLTSA